MKLEDILKSAGWSDADLASVQTMLADQRFRSAMEAQYGAVAEERDKLKARDAEWDRLREEQWQPLVNQREKELADTRLQLASAQEKIKLAKDFGYLTQEQEDAAERERNARAAAATPGNFDPAKYVSVEDARKLMEAEGDAIATMSDLNAEYSSLFDGKTLFEYETEIGGRTMRGARALREEAKAKRMRLDDYVSQKFDFVGKRKAAAEARAKAHDDAIRKEEREKAAVEFAQQYGTNANPNLRGAIPSRSPFMPAPKEGGKQPWQIPQNVKKAERIERALKAQAQGALIQ